MAAKGKSTPLNGAHTAGIFSDMSIDGPQIGTLVMVVDRAKNLPNRKTIGKQDPYCAARLGKEAKKTATDIRGGQTPRWDQELRFIVHDSPDYYQLKVSVFSDDKKTELIGETWVDLRNIIVSGGGQSDQWHLLNCRGKYAGEIRIEITFYDSRPKPDKPALPASATHVPPRTLASLPIPSSGIKMMSQTELNGPSPMPKPGAAPKRRPLPSDPVTGQPPTAPSTPSTLSAPQVPSVSSVLQSLDHRIQTPSRPPPNAVALHTSNQAVLNSRNHTSISTPPHQRPQHQLSSSTPLQYSDQADLGSYARAYPDGASNDGSFASVPPESHAQPYHQLSLHPENYESRQQLPSDLAQQIAPQISLQLQQDRNSAIYHHSHDASSDGHVARQSVYESHSGSLNSFDGAANASFTQFASAPVHDTVGAALPAEDHPPPPPVHRSRDSISGAMDVKIRKSYDSFPQQATLPPIMHPDVLRNAAHRNSISAYPGRPTYRPLDPGTPPYKGLPAAAVSDSPLASSAPVLYRHLPLEYEPSHNRAAESQLHISMETAHPDDPFESSPMRGGPKRLLAPVLSQQDMAQSSHYDYDSQVSVREKNSATALQNVVHVKNTYPITPAGQYHSKAPPYRHTEPAPTHGRMAISASSAHYNDYAQQASFNPLSATHRLQHEGHYDSSEQDQPEGSPLGSATTSYALTTVPNTLVPGMDTEFGLDGRSRMRDEQQRQNIVLLPQLASSSLDNGVSIQSHPHNTPATYSTPIREMPMNHFDREESPSSSRPPSAVISVGSRDVSPNPRHTIRRKSISPAPPSREDGRRLSGIPFSPDSFESLNPSIKTSMDSTRPDYNEMTGKIITHDGREVDPSDHLPVETWAPEPEPKQGVTANETHASAFSPDKGYSTPPSGRRQLRIAGRPQQTSASSVSFSSGDMAMEPYTPTARNRLQKKNTRQSTIGTMSTSPQHGSPLALLPHSKHQSYTSTPPREMIRANTFDVSNENQIYASCDGGMGRGSPVGFKDGGHLVKTRSGGSPMMSGALSTTVGSRVLPWEPNSGFSVNGNTGELALMEELSRIDIGTGRARRHEGRY